MKITKQQLTKIILEEISAVTEGGKAQNTAKGAAMALLDAAKAMEQAPSHEPASHYAKEVAKQANLIMDMLVQMEDEAGFDLPEAPPINSQAHQRRRFYKNP